MSLTPLVPELLIGQKVGGLVHARYPTALTTLCGLPAGTSGALVPTCLVCRATAATFRLIDDSVPASWVLPDARRAA